MTATLPQFLIFLALLAVSGITVAGGMIWSRKTTPTPPKNKRRPLLKERRAILGKIERRIRR